jgi:hypothetical protein
MSNQDNGGLAFPVVGTHEAVIETGMSIRDYMAAKAMQGMLAAAENYQTKELAEHAYQVADAMLAERGAAMSKQPAALVNFLAGWEDENGAMGAILPWEWEAIRDQFTAACVIQSPRMLRNELRRLHAANAELAEVLSDLLAEGEFADYPGTRQADAVKAARAALSKHKEQQ